MFLNMCRFQGLNPWTREAYCIKFGDNPAQLVVGKDTFTRRAHAHPRCKGFRAGVVVITAEGKPERRVGSRIGKGEELAGGWAEVHIDGFDIPSEIEVSLEEYVGKTRAGKVNSQWAKKPGTMIRKVALVQALREAFPDQLGGLFDASELNIDEGDMPAVPVTPPAELEATARIVDSEPNDDAGDAASEADHMALANKVARYQSNHPRLVREVLGDLAGVELVELPSADLRSIIADVESALAPTTEQES